MNYVSAVKKSLLQKVLITVFAVISAVILPQIFHVVGAVSGLGTSVGSAFLPMHIPVILAGLVGGMIPGIIVGILSPVVSFMISGMPGAAVLPFIIAELTAYGFMAGLLSNVRLFSFAKLLIVQISGRLVRALAVLFSIYILANEQLTISAMYVFIIEGLFGILIQWAVIPLATEKLKMAVNNEKNN